MVFAEIGAGEAVTQPLIQFDDGQAYERAMGVWSRLVGDVFLDWLAPAPGLRWIDVGCGNGAFSAVLAQRCAAAAVHGIDPSSGQIAFARTRPGASSVLFQQGDAIALPFADDAFDAATMALVLFFVPDPAKGVAEMARVVRPGGLVAAYTWDILNGASPSSLPQEEMLKLGVPLLLPPKAEASRMAAQRALWAAAGLEAVETREITVQRSFADFEEFWQAASMGMGGIGPAIAAMPADTVEQLKTLLRARLPPDPSGRVSYAARANAIKGRVPLVS